MMYTHVVPAFERSLLDTDGPGDSLAVCLTGSVYLTGALVPFLAPLAHCLHYFLTGSLTVYLVYLTGSTGSMPPLFSHWLTHSIPASMAPSHSVTHFLTVSLAQPIVRLG